MIAMKTFEMIEAVWDSKTKDAAMVTKPKNVKMATRIIIVSDIEPGVSERLQERQFACKKMAMRPSKKIVTICVAITIIPDIFPGIVVEMIQ